MTNLMALEMDVDSRDAGNTGKSGGLFRVTDLVKGGILISTNMHHRNKSWCAEKKCSFAWISPAQPHGSQNNPSYY